MDELKPLPDDLWLDNLYRALSAHHETLKMIERNTTDHQTRQQIYAHRQASRYVIQETGKRLREIKNREPGAL